MLVRDCLLDRSTFAGRVPSVHGDQVGARQLECRSGAGSRGLQNLQIRPASGNVGLRYDEACRVRSCHVLEASRLQRLRRRPRSIYREGVIVNRGILRQSGTSFIALWEGGCRDAAVARRSEYTWGALDYEWRTGDRAGSPLRARLWTIDSSVGVAAGSYG